MLELSGEEESPKRQQQAQSTGMRCRTAQCFLGAGGQGVGGATIEVHGDQVRAGFNAELPCLGFTLRAARRTNG